MLQITIDPSIISVKTEKGDCELAINIAGCAWDMTSDIPCFENPADSANPENSKDSALDKMMNFFYPWRWNGRPAKIIVKYLKTKDKIIGEEEFELIPNIYSDFTDDVDRIKRHYEAVLNSNLLNYDDNGNIIFEDSCLKLNKNKIRYELGNPKLTEYTVENTATDSTTGSLNLSTAHFAQQLSPLNAALNLTFFAKAAAINSDIVEDAKFFIAYPVGNNENGQWGGSVSLGNVNEGGEDEYDIQTISYSVGGVEKLKLFCPITPIPSSTEQKKSFIQLRDENRNFEGHTKIEVHDSEELFNKKEFKEKIIQKTIAVFDLPRLLYEYLEKNISKFEQLDDVQISTLHQQINKLLTNLLRDAYSIGNELNGGNSQTILTDLLQQYNDGIQNESEFIKLTADAVIKAIQTRDENLSFDDWRGTLKLSAKLNGRLEEIEKPIESSEEQTVSKWLELWRTVVAVKSPNNLSAAQNSILNGKKDLFKLQIIQVVNTLFTGTTKQIENSTRLFAEVADRYFENYDPSNLFIESIAININENKEQSQFQTRDTEKIKTILFKTCLKDYAVQRKGGTQTVLKDKLFPSIIDVLNEIKLVPFPESGKDFWEDFIEFITGDDQINLLNLDQEIKDLLTEKATDIPPNVLIKVDEIESDDDLSDEISGHLLVMQRAGEMHASVSDAVEWKCLNWSKINLINKIETIPTSLEKTYLIPSFLPVSDDLRNGYLTLSNQRLSLAAGHDIYDDSGTDADVDSDFQLQYLFDNGKPPVVPPAYALWYGFNYNFAGFVALNSGVLPRTLRKVENGDDWVTPEIGTKDLDTSLKENYKHRRRVPFSKISCEVLREDNKPVSSIPAGLLTIAGELEESKDLPVYLLYDNGKENRQKSIKIKLGKPLTNFWNWYAWNGNRLAAVKNKPITEQRKKKLNDVLEREFEVRGDSKLQNEYLHDPALMNELVIRVEQIFPTVTDNKTFKLKLADEDGNGELEIGTIPHKFIQVEMVENGNSIEFVESTKTVKIPEGWVVKMSVYCQTKSEYFKAGTDRFHHWMGGVVADLESPLNPTGSTFYLTHPVELIFEAAMKPFKVEDGKKVGLISELEVWNSLKPVETEQKQIALNLEKTQNAPFAYYSRTVVEHQVWHWNGRLSANLLKEDNNGKIKEFPENINPKVNAETKLAETNYAMRWEAWEFSDRPDFSALQHTTNLRVSRNKNEIQTIFTDTREVDEKAMYYRFSSEIFGRYELLGGGYIGSVKSAIQIKDEGEEAVNNQWKRYFKPSRKTARLPKPAVRFVIPLTESIDECPKIGEIRSASLMIVLNDRWFVEMGLAEKCEIGIELLNYNNQRYLNAGLDPIISGQELGEIKDIEKFPKEQDFYIEIPKNNPDSIEKGNPIAVFTPEGLAGLTFDFATPTPKLKGSTFILKVDDINQFLTEDPRMDAWSMAQIAVRRNVHKSFWELSNENFLSTVWAFCELKDREKAEIEKANISNQFIDEKNKAAFERELTALRQYLIDEKESEFEQSFDKIKKQYEESEVREKSETTAFDGLKSEWTAKEWVQFLPDTNSMIPVQWRREHTNFGYVAFDKPKNEYGVFVLEPKFKNFEFPKQAQSVKGKVERYLIISERTRNAGGQPVEKYRATYKFDNFKQIFVQNDPDEQVSLDFEEGFARILLVRVEKVSDNSFNIWEKLFGENKENTVGFEDVQEDPKAALPLISKRISIKLEK